MIPLKSAINGYNEHLINTEKSPETTYGYGNQLKKMESYFLKKFNYPPYLDDITLTNLEEYLGSQLAAGLAQASRSRSYHIIRSFYSYCYKKELVERNIALSLEPIKVKRKERTYLTENEVVVLVEKIENELVRIVVTAIYHTGMRISECTNLRLKDVDFENQVIHIIGGKGNKDRDIPISDKLNEILTDYIQNKRSKFNYSEYFFATMKSGRISPQHINRQISAAVKKLKWDKQVSAHILRHSFASKLVQKEVNIVRIQKLLGHSDLRVTSIYTHTSQDELRQAVNVI
ncbi:tyrosine-type recombinase/integrase [Clostridium drakei]|uniref:Recombinase n=1 Tax=Clostridium drakei TaxID=332101 RepID=A0A2U8DKX5_9CLOT|nr:tyrosine-type recombinase/integrase [Clostridium drakei]AWI03125.1 recombinase [Clostridium drakei]